MKVFTSFSLPFVLLLVCIGSTGAKPGQRRNKKNSAPQKPAATPADPPSQAPAPENALPMHYDGPAFAAAPPAAAPGAAVPVPVHPTYQDYLSQFAGEPEWTEELDSSEYVKKNDNKDQDPNYHFDMIWDYLDKMDDKTRDSFIKWLLSSDIGECAFDHSIGRFLQREAKKRKEKALEIAADVLKAEEQFLQNEFGPRTAEGAAKIRDACRETFKEKLELDLKKAEEDFLRRSREKAKNAKDESYWYANPEERPSSRMLAAVAASAAIADTASNSNKKKNNDDDKEGDDEHPPYKKPKKSDKDDDSGNGSTGQD